MLFYSKGVNAPLDLNKVWMSQSKHLCQLKMYRMPRSILPTRNMLTRDHLMAQEDRQTDIARFYTSDNEARPHMCSFSSSVAVSVVMVTDSERG